MYYGIRCSDRLWISSDPERLRAECAPALRRRFFGLLPAPRIEAVDPACLNDLACEHVIILDLDDPENVYQ